MLEIKPSKDFIIAIKLHGLPAYKLAHLAGMDPTHLSKIINGYTKLNIEDPRFLRLLTILALDLEQSYCEE